MLSSFINPFDVPEDTKLNCLSSDAATSSDIEKDELHAEKAGEEAKMQLMR